MRQAVAVAALALIASAPAAAQSRAIADGRRLRPGVDSLAVYYVRGADTLRTGLVRDELAAVEEGGRRLLRRVYASSDRMLGTRLDTLVDVAATLEPVRHRSRTDRGAETLDFAGGRVVGWLRLANGDSVPVRAVLPPGVVSASAFDLVLRAADLGEGWSAEVPAFLPSTRSVVGLRARVAGAETVAGELCWRVEAEFAGTPVTFWIAQASRALRQQAMRGSPEATILFRPLAPVASRNRAS